MKKTIILLMAFLLLFSTFSCTRAEVEEEKTEEEILLENFSYTIGYSNSKYFESYSSLIPDYGYMMRGSLDFEDMEGTTLLTLEEMEASYGEYMDGNQAKTHIAELGKDISEKKILKLDKPEELHDRYSYAFGYILTANIIYQFGELDLPAFRNGFKDGLFSSTPALTEDEMQKAITDYSLYLQKIYEETVLKEMTENLEEAESFLSENLKKEGVIKVNDYCQMVFTKEGSKKVKVEPGDMAVLNYRLTNLQGDVIDQGSSVTFPMDTNQMIRGFVEGCTEMYIGDRATVYIHPEHGYGEYGPDGIGPNRLLIFDIEILGIEG